MKVLFTAAEVSPFSKVGGLADVASSLPKALAKLGHDVRVISPMHQTDKFSEENFPAIGEPFSITDMGRHGEATLRLAKLNAMVPVYLVEDQRYFQRPTIYGEPDDLERYLSFCRVVVDAPKTLGWMPDIFHCHDWHTSPIIFALRNRAWNDPAYRSSSSVLTIHNLRYRGPDEFTDFICQGIYYADVINTVSPTYAREILTPEYGEGLQDLLRFRLDRLFGILNGIDYDEFDPARDPYIAANYGSSCIERKGINKKVLQERMGLASASETPLVGMVSRLTEQKGFDLLAEMMEPFLEQVDVQFVILASGEERYRQLLARLADRFNGKMAFVHGFDAPLAQLIYAGCDIFLMPSRFEPCGLGQLIALRYGAIPVVRRTGGLADTVEDCGHGLEQGNGFVFDAYESGALWSTLERAVAGYRKKETWLKLMRQAMACDFSWQASARQYEKLYQKALAGK